MKSIIGFWLVSLVIKLILGAFLPMSPDEAYYWVWSQHLQLSYYDHPPFVAWLFLIGQFFFDFMSASRWPGIIMGHFSWLIWIYLLKDFLDIQKIKYWFFLILVLPLTGAGGLIVTPDIPLLFFWSCCIYFFYNYTKAPNTTSLIGLGLSLGLGFASKYNIVLFPVCAVIYLASTHSLRLLNFKNLSLLFILFFATASPIFIWNWQNDFISFSFQAQHGLAGGHWQRDWTGLYLVGQFLLLSPVIIYLSTKSLLFKKYSFLKTFGFFPLLFFFITSFRSHVEANWTLVAYPSLIALALAMEMKLKHIYMTVAAYALLFGLLLSEATFPWLPFPKHYLKTSELRKFSEIYSHKNLPQPLFARNYQMAAKVSFETKEMLYKLRGLNRLDFYDFIKHEPLNEPVIYGLLHRYDLLPQWVTDLGYKEIWRKQIALHSEYYLTKFVKVQNP